MTNEIVAYYRQQQDDMVNLLIEMIKHESPTHNKAAVDRMADFVTSTLEPLNPSSITRIPLEEAGDIVLGKWNEDAPGKPLLVLMHMDTVWDVGRLEEQPITQDDEGRLYGPGAIDMKGGLVIAITAVRGLIERDDLPNRPIWLMFTSDEETGSAHAEPHINAAAEQAEAVFVMEPPAPDGSLKTGRKGVASYTVKVTGRASHAGNHPEEGVNAILELSQQTVAISKLQDLRNGVSVAVNTFFGGTATNVIAAQATATIDVRAFRQYDMDHVHEELTALMPKIPGSNVEVTLNHMRGPMERSEEIEAAFERAKQIGKDIGISVTEEIVGGASDANITASIGVPTIDGLGPRGAGLHADHEHVIIRSLPERAAHLAAMLRDWS